MEEDLTTNVRVLESHLEGMLDRVEQNSLTLKKFQTFEMVLLQLNSLADMIEHILHDARLFFDLDVVSFCLLDEKHDIAQYLHEDGYNFEANENLILLQHSDKLKETLGYSGNPYLGRYDDTTCQIFFPSQHKPESVAIIPLARRGRYMGSLNFGSYRQDRFIFNMATDFIEHMVSVVSICLENNLNFETMRRTSLVDTLTGINNRRFFEQRISEELDRSQRQQQPLSCLFLDIDHFKQINDNYGHQTGDEVLSAIAKLFKIQLRNNDVLARYGGEEFVALLTGIDETMAQEIAERIRRQIEEHPIEYNQQVIHVTASVGTSTYLPENKITGKKKTVIEKLIQCADDALYRAKKNGRNRVENGGKVSDCMKT